MHAGAGARGRMRARTVCARAHDANARVHDANAQVQACVPALRTCASCVRPCARQCARARRRARGSARHDSPRRPHHFEAEVARLDLPEKVLECAARARRVFPAGPVHLAEGAVAARSRAAVRLTVNAENTRRVRSQRMQYALKKSHDCVALLTGCGASQSAGFALEERHAVGLRGESKGKGPGQSDVGHDPKDVALPSAADRAVGHCSFEPGASTEDHTRQRRYAKTGPPQPI